MSGRRKLSRITFLNSLGVLRISHDVFVERAADNEMIAVSTEPAIPGEELTIVFAANDYQETDAVRVVASRPVFADGALKHELRLRRIEARLVATDNHQDPGESGSK